MRQNQMVLKRQVLIDEGCDWLERKCRMEPLDKHPNENLDKPGLFCAEPNSPPVLGVVPNVDAPKPPVVPNPVSAHTELT